MDKARDFQRWVQVEYPVELACRIIAWRESLSDAELAALAKDFFIERLCTCARRLGECTVVFEPVLTVNTSLCSARRSATSRPLLQSCGTPRSRHRITHSIAYVAASLRHGTKQQRSDHQLKCSLRYGLMICACPRYHTVSYRSPFVRTYQVPDLWTEQKTWSRPLGSVSLQGGRLLQVRCPAIFEGHLFVEALGPQSRARRSIT